MATVNHLTSIKLGEMLQQKPQHSTRIEDNGEGKNFASTLSDFVDTVNDSYYEAATKAEEVVTGKSENLQDAMLAMSDARVTFQLMLEVRNRLMESYREIKSMQV